MYANRFISLMINLPGIQFGLQSCNRLTWSRFCVVLLSQLFISFFIVSLSLLLLLLLLLLPWHYSLGWALASFTLRFRDSNSFLVWDCSPTPNPQPGGPGLHIYIPWRLGGPVIAPILVAFYDMHELQWDYSFPRSPHGEVSLSPSD
jgi:hypothetical protein